MKSPSLYALAILAALTGSLGCDQMDRPTAPTVNSRPASSPPVSPWDVFPPVSGATRVYAFSGPVTRVVTSYTPQSRYVLYDDGRFALQYGSLGLEYRGAFTQTGNLITFGWEGWSAAGPWGATAELNGDSMTVRYNLIMQLTDFEDAVYALTR